jgi:hypothetical protein
MVRVAMVICQESSFCLSCVVGLPHTCAAYVTTGCTTVVRVSFLRSMGNRAFVGCSGCGVNPVALVASVASDSCLHVWRPAQGGGCQRLPSGNGDVALLGRSSM